MCIDRLDIFVDDVSVGTARLQRASNANEGDHSYLMVGGIRAEMGAVVGDFIGIQQSLTGCVQDVVVNDQLVDLSEPVRHQAAAVGRCHHIPLARGSVAEERMQANERPLARCRESPQYTIEGRAVKFGDAPNSHVVISASRKELVSSFNFTLDFRTHYPNGLIFYSSVSSNYHQIVNHYEDNY